MIGVILNDGGTTLRFYVDRIGNNNADDYSKLDYWVIVSISVSSPFFNYSNRGESLQYAELISMRDAFNLFLENRLTQEKHLDFIEPEYEFVLHPKHDETNPCVDFKINEVGGYGGQYVLSLFRKEIVIWRDYLDKAIKNFDARNIEDFRNV